MERLDLSLFGENAGGGLEKPGEKRGPFGLIFIAYWICLNGPARTGYRLTIENPGEWEGKSAEGAEKSLYRLILERMEPTGVQIAEEVIETHEESFHNISIIVNAGTITVEWDFITVLTAHDATFTHGEVGLEGQGVDLFGTKQFRHNGVLIDDLEREENPLAAGKWLQLQPEHDTGKCHSATYGWVSKDFPGISSAYWSEEEAEPEPETRVAEATSGIVPYNVY